MQHNETNGPGRRFRRLLKEKGYYIVLTLCLVAVGVSGYVFFSTAAEQNEELDKQVLSVPVVIDDPEEKPAEKPAASQREDAPAAEVPQEEAEPVDAPVEDTVVLPVSGSCSRDHAMDRLTWNETTRDWRVHNGIDLTAETGSPVMAARAGQVTAVFEDDFYGTTVVIHHEDDYTTHYCSLDPAVLVEAGDTVEAGQVIGAVGTTALLESAEEPHLHFEVYCAGAPVDPTEFLP